ncbi:MAG: winged helix DNA-binding domain-containing protein, partial [Clostridia bacterium]|nr:winged helix DNA-binding domain-containing protein [Clostridia bacterium]
HGMDEGEEASIFDAWGGGIRELCERGFMHYAVQEKKAYVASPRFTPIPEETAKLEIARRYFTNMGPATIHDAMYYTGAKQSEVKAWLSVLPVESFVCEGKTYYSIPSGRSYDRDIPPCIFLAGFDQLMLAYQKKESLYLPAEHLRGIFNLAGIVMPSVLLHGRVVGKWKKEPRRLTVTLFEAIDVKARETVRESAARLFGTEIGIAFVS